MWNTINGRSIEYIIVDEASDWNQLPHVNPEWYDDPVDKMTAFMGFHPGPSAKYTIPREELVKDTQGYLMTWNQRYGRWYRVHRGKES